MSTLNQLGGDDAHIEYVFEGLDLSSASRTADFPVQRTATVGVQFTWSGQTAGTTDFVVQSSLNGNNFDNVTGTAFTTSGASGSETFSIANFPGKYVRAIVTSANGTDPTPVADIYFNGKR